MTRARPGPRQASADKDKALTVANGCPALAAGLCPQEGGGPGALRTRGSGVRAAGGAVRAAGALGGLVGSGSRGNRPPYRRRRREASGSAPGPREAPLPGAGPAVPPHWRRFRARAVGGRPGCGEDARGCGEGGGSAAPRLAEVTTSSQGAGSFRKLPRRLPCRGRGCPGLLSERRQQEARSQGQQRQQRGPGGADGCP